MAFLGNIGVFSLDDGDWQIYVERLEQFFAVNEIAEERQVAALLSLVGEKTYKLIRSLTAPAAPNTKTFRELIDLVQNHLRPTPLVAVERFRFNKMCQEKLSVQEFLAELKLRSEHCAFGVSLNESICDRFVCGLRSSAIQKRLLTEPQLTLQRAVDIATSMETAARDIEELNPGSEASGSAAVNRLKSQDLDKKKQTHTNKQIQKNSMQNVCCYRCGNKGHYPSTCKFRSAQCRFCHKQGHIMRVCRNRTKSNPPNPETEEQKQNQNNQAQQSSKHKAVRHVTSTDDTDVDEALNLFNLRSSKSDPIMVQVMIENRPVSMEVDTGSAISVISMKDYESDFGHIAMHDSDVHLVTYTGEQFRPKGWIEVIVTYREQCFKKKLYVAEQQGAVSLMGRDWLSDFRLDWASIKSLRSEKNESLQQVLDKHKGLFSDKLGCLKNFKASLHLKDGAKPIFLKARPVPYSLRKAVEDELCRLEELGIITPLKYSEWATPIVPVIKKDGTVRICGDYRLTVNRCLDVDQYPLPLVQDMFAKLSGGCVFSKLDLERAYQQLEVEEASADMLTINTHKGLFRMNRLSFGVASAPAIFQRTMDQVLQKVTGSQAYLDDILIKGQDTGDHLQNLDSTLTVLENSGLKLKPEKCDFQVPELTFLGHIISSEGLRASPGKVEAVVKAPRPVNVTELRSFLGLVNYYAKFLPNLSTVLRPLHELLRKDVDFLWLERQEEAFRAVKKMLIAAPVLTHYDPEKPLILACDASAYGLGAVLSHLDSDKSEHPVAFASRTLTKAEQGYAQVEKEALALIFGIKRFHQFLYGRKFILLTDHQPLVKILGPKTGVPIMAAARLQRWALFLSAYQYEICYRKGNEHTNADGLSRLPLKHAVEDDTSVEVFHIRQLDRLPVTSAIIARETKKDLLLSQVLIQTTLGWKPVVEPDLKPFYTRKNELTIEQGCLLWGIRVLIPEVLRRQVLQELHICHTGVVRMKTMARGYFWWPSLDQDIEQLAGNCTECLQQRNSPALAPLHPWAFPEKPWQRLHVDYAGPFLGTNFFVLVDSYSKWPEVAIMPSTTATKTVDFLRTVFARFGLPEQIVSDNGAQFTSETFKVFLQANGVKHFCSAPYHPATNGLAECFVQTVKSTLKKCDDEVTLPQHLQQFLLTYRNNTHPTTGRRPAQLLLGGELRTRPSLLRPDVKQHVVESQAKQQLKRSFRKQRELNVGDAVLIRDYRTPGKMSWEIGVISAQTGPISFEVQTDAGQTWRCHQDQLVKTPQRTSEDREKFGEDTFDTNDFFFKTAFSRDPECCGLSNVKPR